jgi:hypothetical protein
MGRNAIGIEILPEYYQLAKANIPAVVQVPARQLSLLEETEPYESTEPDAIHSNPGLSNRRSKCLLP